MKSRTRMKGRAALAVSALAAGVTFAALSPVLASDHLDGPRSVADPQADITDVFAFTSPERPGHLVVAMTVTPFASALSGFSSQIHYIFRVRRVTAPQPFTLGVAPLDITCDFDDNVGAAQKVTCSGPAGLATARFGDSTGGGGGASMRVFAGRRADPAFFDRQGALATVVSGRASFTGQNAFAAADVLAIVVDVDATALDDAGGGPPMLAVAAETVRNGR